MFKQAKVSMNVLLGNSLWHLVAQSDGMTKAVLLLLFGMSVVCWSLMFYKVILLQLKKKQIFSFSQKLKKDMSIEDLTLLASQNYKTYSGHLLNAQLETTDQLISILKEKPFDGYQEQLLEDQRISTIETMLHVQEQYLPVLSVSATIAPLLGLFGTVWGLTHSLITMSQKQTADIVATAPGIAEALLTTLAGLVVAIPVAIMYHYVRSLMNEVEFHLTKSSEKVQSIIVINLLKGKEGHEIKISPAQKTNQTTTS